MKNLVGLLFFTLFTASIINAQKIEMNKVFGGYEFNQNDKTLLLKDMKVIMKENTKALALVCKNKSDLGYAFRNCRWSISVYHRN